MNRRYIALLTVGHLFTDINQGALPAILPFLVHDQGMSYTAAAGLVFAANAASSVIQPLFGYWADRISKPWIIPAGVFLAGFGLAISGILGNYLLVFLAVSLSGIGIAAFHPEAARLANFAAGQKKAAGVSIFTTGGNVGFAVGPIVTTWLLYLGGLEATLFLAIPTTLVAVVFCFQTGNLARISKSAAAKSYGSALLYNDWKAFSRLLVAVCCRSIIFFGFNTFLPLYWISVLGQSKGAAGTALTILLTMGAIGTLIAGRLADNYGYRTIVRLGFGALIPLVLIFVNTGDVFYATLLLIPLGMAVNAPFSSMVVMGQKYLPGHMGLASGVTMGLAVSVGGIFTPLFGRLADVYGIGASMSLLAVLPVVATAVAFTLPKPGNPRPAVSAEQPSADYRI